MITVFFVVAPFIAVLLVGGIWLLNRDEGKSRLKSMRANHAFRLKLDKSHMSRNI